MKDELAKCLGCPSAPCKACPCGTDVGQIIRLAKESNLDEAGRLLFQNNPLSAITSAICPNHEFCAQGCVLSKAGKAVNFATIEHEISVAFLDKISALMKPPPIHERAKKFAIFGSGPAGLAFAFYARLAGHYVTIFEVREKIGGMLQYGIPDIRLDKNLVDKFGELLEKMGVTIVTKCDFLIFNDIRTFDEYVIATGASISKKVNIPGEEHTIPALEFLRSANTEKQDFKKKTIVVVGGGNVAIDCALVAKNSGAKTILCYRKTRDFLKAGQKEIGLAEKMGVQFEFEMNPKRFEEDRVIFETKCKKTDEMKEVEIKADKIIVAVGQKTTQLQIDSAHYIGDCVDGTKTVIEAVASAKQLFNAMFA